MGSELSQPSPVPEDVKEDVKEAGFIMTEFFKAPTEENYQKILQFKKDVPEMRLYFGHLKTEYGLGGTPTEEEINLISTEKRRLLSSDTILTPFDLDCLWGMFGVTGDTTYSDRVKSVLNDSRVGSLTKGSAMWSYTSFVQQGLLEK